MTGAAAWLLVALGLTVVVVRRRSVAIALVTVQALVIATVALAAASTGDEVAGAALLAARGVGLAALLLLVVARTRQPFPIRPATQPLVRVGLGVALALLLLWLVPEIGLTSRDAERAALSLIALGAVAIATRRTTIHQVAGVVLVENGLALAAIELPRASSLVIEIGVTLDLVLVVLVAIVFHQRIHAEYGSGDVAVLRELRD